MKNCLTWHGRKELHRRLTLSAEMRLRTADWSPAAFRRALQFSAHDRTAFEGALEPWQQADFAALDPAWEALAGLDVTPKFRRAYIERPRGHGKTSDMAVQVMWILLASPRSLQGLAAAADLDQANLLRTAIMRMVQLNGALCAPLDFRQNAVINSETGSRLQIITSDVQSSWGALPDFVICDELTHWTSPDLWYSLFSSAAKQPHCVLTILTNAGIGRGWQWEVREAARRSESWHFSSIQGPQAPWIRAADLQEQRELLPRSVYDRLWENIWQESGGEFVTLAEAEACRDESLKRRESGEPRRFYIAAIDYAEKRDYTVGVVVHREGHRIVVDLLDVVRPTPDNPVKVSWVEDWIERVGRAFHQVTFIVDEYQLVGAIQRLSRQFDIRRFEFMAGRGNHALALNLRRLIIHRDIRWYAGCGSLDVPWGRDDLETELASVILKQSSTGMCRIDHLSDAQHHDDRAFALGAACLHAMDLEDGGGWMQVDEPQVGGGFGW